MADAAEFRWRLSDDDGGQGRLFEHDPFERHIGTGEFRGMEFLHVKAKRMINEVPRSSRLPFRFTINAYRGCSHACHYCLGPETPVLMGDSRVKAIGELDVGDEICGTERVGDDRRLVRTGVLATWRTTQSAYRVRLEDGTELVSSGDHRYLTACGWKHVTGTERGPLQRPHLTFDDELVGIGTYPMTRQDRVCRDPAVREMPAHSIPSCIEARLRVVAIEPLGKKMEMVDITTGTGDFIANGVVSHNCFARPTHEYLGMNAGEDFEKRIVVKINAVEQLRAELAPKRWAGDHIAMGTNTDPYQRCEGKYHLTRGIIQELGRARNSFSILTKSSLILRDIDVLTEAAQHADVRANFSIGTLDADVWRATEPGTPHPRKRIEAVAKLNEAGIPCGVLVAPVLPGLSDREDQLEAVVKACVDAGAVSISPILLHLRPGVREHYLAWLAQARPDLLEEHERLYPRSYAPKARQDALSTLVARLVARHQKVRA